MYNIWLVVLTILKNMSSSMGQIISYIMENVWNHQPVYIYGNITSETIFYYPLFYIQWI